MTAPYRTPRASKNGKLSGGPQPDGPHLAPSPTDSEEAGKLDERLSATWRYDLPAGVVVFLVALPLCLGIALASGAPLLAGLITGIIGGAIVSKISGSQLLVSGPAAGLTAIVITAITQLGSFEVFLVAVVIAGAIQLVLGLLRAGIIGYFFPSSVIRGMLAAIGLILILKQLPYALGVTPEGGSSIGAIISALGSALPLAVGLTISSLLILAFWGTFAPAGLRKLVPAALVVVMLGVVGTAAAAAFVPELALPASAMVTLPTPSSLGELASLLSFPDWSALSNPLVWKVAVTIGIVASLETLLSLEATDKLDPWKRNAPANRELLAQGIGNMLSGAVGGLPMTGEIGRAHV